MAQLSNGFKARQLMTSERNIPMLRNLEMFTSWIELVHILREIVTLPTCTTNNNTNGLTFFLLISLFFSSFLSIVHGRLWNFETSTCSICCLSVCLSVSLPQHRQLNVRHLDKLYVTRRLLPTRISPTNSSWNTMKFWESNNWTLNNL